MCPQTTRLRQRSSFGLRRASTAWSRGRNSLAAGVTSHEIRHRVRSGALLREHRGVYRVGHHAPSVEARYLAAVLACGDGARLSGRAAAHLFGLVKGRVRTPEVTTPLKRHVEGVKVRRGHIAGPDRAVHRGIPITAVARTLTDLAAVLSVDDLARVRHEAGVRFGTTPAHVAEVLSRRPRTTGAAKLVRSSAATHTSRSAGSSGVSSSSCARTDFRCPR